MFLCSCRYSRLGKPLTELLEMKVGDNMYAVKVVDPIEGFSRYARIVALCKGGIKHLQLSGSRRCGLSQTIILSSINQ